MSLHVRGRVNVGAHSSRHYRDGWGCFPLAPVPRPLGFDLNSALLAREVMAKAAPGPVLGLFDETSLDGVAVQVAQLLHMFLLGKDVEVVVSGLPELGPFAFEYFRCLALEDAECGGERLDFWLGEQQVDVLGHEDIAEEKELVTLSKLLECFLEDDAGAVVVQVGKTAVATEGDEVVVAFGLITLETARHEVNRNV